MNVDPLIRALAGAMILLEEADDAELDQHLAVRGLENIGYELMQVGQEDRAEFLEAIRRVAASEGNPRAADYIRGIPFKIGMTVELRRLPAGFLSRPCLLGRLEWIRANHPAVFANPAMGEALGSIGIIVSRSGRLSGPHASLSLDPWAFTLIRGAGHAGEPGRVRFGRDSRRASLFPRVRALKNIAHPSRYQTVPRGGISPGYPRATRRPGMLDAFRCRNVSS